MTLESAIDAGDGSADAHPICEMIAAFADGELDAIAAQAFREHLAGCSTCERQLLTQLQLGAALSLLTRR